MWAKALAAGVPDEIFWATTPRELQALVHEKVDRESAMEKARAKAADYRTAAIMAEIRNQWVPKGERPWTAKRILAPKPRKRPEGEPDWGRFIAGMRGRFAAVNKMHEA